MTLTLLVIQTAAGHAAQTYRVGTLTGSIPSRQDPAQRYALYLPSTFDGRKPAPILFIMDYRGRGRVAAEVFVPAAERFGWILMSSYNTASDQAATQVLVALRTMWIEAHDLFPIDDRRIYLAGLSGTARTATWLAAQLPRTFTGIIGAAAGFETTSPPSAAMDFLYFGTVGDADYNYWEMRELDSRLADLRLAHRIEEFSGGHGWMPRDLAMAAAEWMELRAMQAGSREVGPAFVDEKWARDLQTVATYEEGGRPLAASRRLEAMARDYTGLRPNDDLAMVAARSVRLAAEPGIRVQARAQQLAAAAHAERIQRAMRMIAGAFPAGAAAPAQPAATIVADLGIPELRAAAGRNDQAALAARRLIAELDVQTGFYLPVAAMQVNEDGRAAFYLEIARAIAPDDPFAWFLRAKIFARARNTTAAIDALRQAVNRGFRTLDALEHDPAFDVLRPRRDFLVLVEQVRAAWASDR